MRAISPAKVWHAGCSREIIRHCVRTSPFNPLGSPLLQAALLVLLFGCGGDNAGEAPELRLGTGEASFESASSGETLTLYAGTQGGHHVWLSMRMRGFDPESLRMLLDVVPPEPLMSAHTDVSLHFTLRDDDSDDGLPYEYAGWPARVLMPECAVGKEVLLRVTLRDGKGHEASEELTVIAGAPNFPFSSECEL